MNTLFNLTENGYEIHPTDFDRVAFAYSKATGDKFFFDVRKKQTASLRRATGLWELGVDVPDYIRYFAPDRLNPKIPFYIFFETTNPNTIRYILRDNIGKLGRRWLDREHFPDGIIFVNVATTTVLNHGESILASRTKQSKLR